MLYIEWSNSRNTAPSLLHVLRKTRKICNATSTPSQQKSSLTSACSLSSQFQGLLTLLPLIMNQVDIRCLMLTWLMVSKEKLMLVSRA